MASMGALRGEERDERPYEKSYLRGEIRYNESDEEYNGGEYHTKTGNNHDLSQFFEIGADKKDYSQFNKNQLNRYINDGFGKRFVTDENNEYFQSQLELEKLEFLDDLINPDEIEQFYDGQEKNENVVKFLSSLLDIAQKQLKGEKLKDDEKKLSEFLTDVLIKNEIIETPDDVNSWEIPDVAEKVNIFFGNVPEEHRDLSVSMQAYFVINGRMPEKERDVQNDMFAYVGEDGTLQSCYADALPFGFAFDELKHAKVCFGRRGKDAVIKSENLKSDLEKLAKKDFGAIVFIIYYNENHFLAAKWSKKENGFELIVLDPYKYDQKCDEFFEELENSLRESIEGISIKYKETNRQADGSTCGLVAILLAKALGNGDDSILLLSSDQQEETEQDLARNMVEYVKNLRATNQKIN